MTNPNIKYVLITPAKNEEQYIEKTLSSVISQNILPQKWIIVSDASTDNTDYIVNNYAKKHNIIKLISVSGTKQRNFSSKVNAFKIAYEEIKNYQYDFIGNLDADVSFEVNYYERIIEEFKNDNKLGIGGGIILELVKGEFIPQNISLNSVAGAVQLFRRQCYEETGGYIPLWYGGVDAAAEIMARAKGWNVKTFPQTLVSHHRRVTTGKRSVTATSFQQGITNYMLGYYPPFQIISSLYRLLDKPYFLSGMLTLSGYFFAAIRKYKKQLPEDVILYLRSEQKGRLRSIIFGGKDINTDFRGAI